MIKMCQVYLSIIQFFERYVVKDTGFRVSRLGYLGYFTKMKSNITYGAVEHSV